MILEGGVEAWRNAKYPIIERKPVSSLLARILVPLDGSDASEAVLYQAERLLCGRKSEVILLHAWNPAAHTFSNPKAAEDYLNAIGERLSSGGTGALRVLVREASSAEAILAAVESERPSLVAMSSHGSETSPDAAVSGTVQGVLKQSRAPLFVARAFQHSASGVLSPAKCEPSPLRRILVPLDGSNACEAVMPFARDLGKLLSALIVILHVSDDKGYDPGGFSGRKVSGRPEGAPPDGDASPQERIEYAAKTFSAAGLETMTLNLGGDPVSTILAFARPSAVDLVALTTHGRTGLPKLLMGSVAERVLREAILPTLLVRSDASGEAACA